LAVASQPRFRVAYSHLRTLARRPVRYLRTLSAALGGPGGGSRGNLSRIAYFVGAVVVWEECRRRRLHHVHAHFTSPAADVARLVALLGAGDRPAWSWSFTAHGTDIFNDSPQRLAGKVRDADLVICVSHFGRSRLMAMVEDDHWDKIRVIRCGLGVDWLASAAARADIDAPLKVLSIGRLEREKGHAILLEALARLHQRGVPIRAEIVGGGSLHDTLQRRAAELRIEAVVSFTGPVGQDRIRAHYLEADVFCLPSLGEGVPVVLMEAMACGLPVVATRTMGIPELVEDGMEGMLVDPGRPQPLADALQQLSEDTELRFRMGDAGRVKVRTEFALENAVDELRLCFETLIAPPPDTSVDSPSRPTQVGEDAETSYAS
jgi:glycosyltransferase involved in cell wall biosynthesis